jgi:serine/threonine-protein kinase
LAVIGGKTPIPSIRTRNPGLPEALEWIVARALSRDLDKRYQTGREMQHDLEQWLRSQPEPAGTAEIAVYMHAVFAGRINERAGLFERALRGELTPAGAEQLRPKHRTGSQASMPGATVIQRRRRSRTGPALVVLALLGAAAFGAYTLWGSGPASAPAPAPPRLAMLDVKTEPAGAQLKLDGAAQGTAPLSLELAPGSHEISAELAGYRPASRVLRVPPGGERQQLTLTLAEIPAPPLPPSAAPAPASEAGGPGHSKPVVAPAHRGKLSLDTSPWTRVSLGGKNLGDTPLLEVPLPAGRHVLQLVNEQQGINRSVEVEIEAGKTTVKRLHL